MSFKIPLAKHNNCFWPLLKLSNTVGSTRLLSLAYCSKPAFSKIKFNLRTFFIFKITDRSASLIISALSIFPVGSKFSRIVASKITGSC